MAAVEFGSLKELAAYVVLAPGVTTLDRDRASDHLRTRLPEYMIPRYLDVIDELPQMTSGKIDRKLLPPPKEVLGRAGHVMVPPETATERAVAACGSRYSSRHRSRWRTTSSWTCAAIRCLRHRR